MSAIADAQDQSFPDHAQAMATVSKSQFRLVLARFGNLHPRFVAAPNPPLSFPSYFPTAP